MRMSGQIIEEHIAGLAGDNGWLGLVVGDFVQSGENDRVNSACVIKKSSRDGLNTLSVFFIEKRRLIIVGVLYFLAINRASPLLGSMLSGGGLGMFEFGPSFGDIVGHGYVNISSIVIPVDRETEVASAGPIFGERISVMERGKEVMDSSKGAKSVSSASLWGKDLVERRCFAS
jgi:hypothetical protein